MKVAICGYPPLALQLQAGLQNSNIEFKFFISDFVSAREQNNFFTNLPQVTFFEFRRLIDAGELDGVIIVEDEKQFFVKNAVHVFKFYGIPNVGVINLESFNPFNPIFGLDTDKIFIPYLETNIIDGCNLNCKGCTHFAELFSREEIYPLETFRRDVRRLSQLCDIYCFRLLGGEPLLLDNLNDYLKIANFYLPNTWLKLVTNGLLIPSLPQKILDAIRENNFVVDISEYPPTMRIADKIKNVLNSNEIKFNFSSIFGDKFGVFLTLHGDNNPAQSRTVCFNDHCRFLRDGKIYKCPIDALSYRFAEKFGLKNYPKATGVDLYASNFSSTFQMLDGNVEMCHWCGEQNRLIPWEPSNKPRLEDWLSDPEEIKKLQ